MSYLTERFLQKPILRSQFLSLAAISLVLIALQATPASAQWATNGNNINNTNTGNVGIGTVSPDAKLTIAGTSGNYLFGLGDAHSPLSAGVMFSLGANGNLPLEMISSSSASFYRPLINWFRSRGTVTSPANVVDGDLLGSFQTRPYIGGWGLSGAINFSVDGAASTNVPTKLTFSTSDSTDGITTSAARLTTKPNGNVGIGTETPSTKLEVLGNINVTGTGNINAAGTITGGTIYAKYQDVAEWVPSSEQVPAGTVVVLDSTKSNQVISSMQAYDTRVDGVISKQPGITLGERGDSKVLVATTGRVRVKVDATRSPIHVGDLLVTSDVPGLAMKSEPVIIGGVQLHRPGTLIGKALEPLANAQGEILVLLSLQ